MCDSPFIIVGSGSTGSTLLAVMLDSHPMIACGPELGVFNKKRIYKSYALFKKALPKWLKEGLPAEGYSEYRAFFCDVEYYGWDRQSLIGLSKRATSLREFFDLFFERFLVSRRKRVWGEQTPGNAYCLAEFLELYPRAKVLHIVRDGRDVFCSFLRRPGSSAFHSASSWLYNTSAAYRFRGHRNYLEIRYEKLVEDPRRELLRICTHLDIGFDEGMLHPSQNDYWENLKSKFHKSWSLHPGQEISKSSVGRHQEEMTSDMLNFFYRISLSDHGMRQLGVSHRSAGELMKLLGYIDTIPTALPQLPLKYYIDVFKCGFRRFVKELLLEKRLWKPCTAFR